MRMLSWFVQDLSTLLRREVCNEFCLGKCYIFVQKQSKIKLDLCIGHVFHLVNVYNELNVVLTTSIHAQFSVCWRQINVIRKLKGARLSTVRWWSTVRASTPATNRHSTCCLCHLYYLLYVTNLFHNMSSMCASVYTNTYRMWNYVCLVKNI